jgi:hypothetical protein
LLFSEYQSATLINEETKESATVEEVSDAWEEAQPPAIVEQPEPAAPVRSVAKGITPDPVLVVELPIATLMDEEPSDSEKEGIAIDVDRDRYQAMTAVQLRKECSTVGIKWRNAHGKSKHLSKAEMIAELSC